MKKRLLPVVFALATAFPSLAQNVGVNTTGNPPDAKNMFEVLQPSTTTNTVGIWAEHSGVAGAGTTYGLKAIASGASLNSVAAYLEVTGGTNKYALIIPANGGIAGIGTVTPTAGYLLTLNTNGTVSKALDISLSGGSGNGVNITSGSSGYNNLVSTHSGSASATYYAVGGHLTSGVSPVSGYLGYHTGTGNIATNYFAGYFKGKTAITSNTSPDGIADLEVQNTTSGAGNPATVFLRQTTSNDVSNTVLNNVNFGDNRSTSPQAQMQILRDAAGGAGDLPTAISFSTTPDGSSTLTERMKLNNAGTLRLNAYTTDGIVRTTGGNGTLSSTGGGINLASEVTGILPLANGGANANLTAINGGIVYSTGTAFAISPAGTAGQALISGGAGAPTWSSNGLPIRWDQLLAPTANLTLAHAGNITDFSFNSVTTTSAFKLSSSSLTTGKILDVQSTSGTGVNITHNAENSSNDGYAIRAWNKSTTAATNANFADRVSAVYAQTDAPNSIGVFGRASSASATQSIGVWGYGSGGANSIGILGIGNAQAYSTLAAGAGGYFIGSRYGTYTSALSTTNGTNFGSSGVYAGVFGSAGSSSAQYHAGVYGYQIGSGNNSGGVVGAYSSVTWGALGYTDGSATPWGIYTPVNAYIGQQVTIAGGNPGANKVLTSDATGLATWETPGRDQMILSAKLTYSEDDISGWSSLSGDDNYVNITLPFSITLGGTSYSIIHLSTNGWLEFFTSGGGTATNATNSCLPTSSNSNPTLYWFWDDLVPTGSNIRYITSGTSPNRVFFIDFQCYLWASSSEDIEGTVQIHEGSGLMNVSYKETFDAGARGQTATIGFQLAGGASAKAYPLGCNVAILDDNLSYESGWSICPVR